MKTSVVLPRTQSEEHQRPPEAAHFSARLPGARFLLPTAPPGPHGLSSWYETDAEGELDGRIYELREQLQQLVEPLCKTVT